MARYSRNRNDPILSYLAKFLFYSAFSILYHIPPCKVSEIKIDVILLCGNVGSLLKYFEIRCGFTVLIFTREKGRDLTQSCDKNPFTHRTIQKATWQHKNATKNFDYTTIADRLRTVSWSNSSHPTGVVKPVYERSTFPLTATAA